MKKLLTPALLYTTLSACVATTATTTDETQLIGRWQCITQYPDSILSTTTDDIITFHPDHRADDVGNIVMQMKDLTFRYRRDSQGTWKLEGNRLSFLWRDVPPTTPNHDPDMQKRIDSDPEIRNIEQTIASIFKPQKDVIIVLRIDSIGKDKMEQTQLSEVDDTEMAKSSCTRL